MGNDNVMVEFKSRLTEAQRVEWDGLDSPARIQAFLDRTPYSPEDRNRCPASVLADRQAHCLDGGMFAAAALRALGYPPLVLDMFPDPGMDDDHVLAIYQVDGRWGALAKSNFAGLRYREPVYRGLRELVMSYFECYYNLHGVKTLRTYTRPFNLATLDKAGWMWSQAGADAVEQRLLHLARRPLITSQMAAGLSPVDERSYQAGMLGTNPAGLYQPKQ